MRSLLITPLFPPALGGVQKVLYNLCLFSPPEEVVVLTQRHPQASKFDAHQPFRIYRELDRFWPQGSIWSKLKWFQLAGYIVRLARREDVSVLQWGECGFSPWVFHLTRRLSRLPSALYVWGREIKQRLRNPHQRCQLQAILSQVDCIISVSHYTRTLIGNAGTSLPRIEVLHPGVDLREFSPKGPNQRLVKELSLEGKKVILTVSRLVERKGQDVLIRAFALVRQQVPEVVLLIVGTGPYEPSLRKLVWELQLESQVRMLGELENNFLSQYYNLCEVFALISRESENDVEGFGLVYLEAGACGKPVVAGRSGGVPEAVVDGVTGLLVNPLSEEETAAAIIHLLTHPQLARTLGKNARHRLEQQFQWELRAQRLRKILHSLSEEVASA